MSPGASRGIDRMACSAPGASRHDEVDGLGHSRMEPSLHIADPDHIRTDLGTPYPILSSFVSNIPL